MRVTDEGLLNEIAQYIFTATKGSTFDILFPSGCYHHCGDLSVSRVHLCDHLGVLFVEDYRVPCFGNQWLHYLDYSR